MSVAGAGVLGRQWYRHPPTLTIVSPPKTNGFAIWNESRD